MDAWPRCLERLEAELPAEDVHTWLKPLQAEQRPDAVVLYAPNAFIVDQVRERYLPRIRELLDHYAGLDQVSLAVGSRARTAAPGAFAGAPASLGNTATAPTPAKLTAAILIKSRRRTPSSMPALSSDSLAIRLPLHG